MGNCKIELVEGFFFFLLSCIFIRAYKLIKLKSVLDTLLEAFPKLLLDFNQTMMYGVHLFLCNGD